jgi:hypothetical protein
VRTTSNPVRSRSANLWFGRLLEGDDYRWSDVSHVYGPDFSLSRDFIAQEPFGHDWLIISYSSILACDPQPITPEHIDAFFDRWIELFAQVATSDDRAIAQLLPGKFNRQPISPAFRPRDP